MPKNEVQQKEETRLDRAKKERLYYMGRAASGASGNSTSFIVSGQSGKIWTVTIPASGPDAEDDGSRTSAREHLFRCNCPDRKCSKFFEFLDFFSEIANSSVPGITSY